MKAVRHDESTSTLDLDQVGGAMDSTTFDRIRAIVYDKSGISLGSNKQALVRARIAKRLRRLKIADFDSYLDYVIHDNSGEEIQQMLDAISTNVTSFYREPSHFDFMRQAIENWMAGGMHSFRFWSAAASTGEEPYTMAIEAQEAVGNGKVDMKILATDISSRVLQISTLGEYSEDKIAPVPVPLRNKYFTKQKAGNRYLYTVQDKIRKLVIFRQFNLSSPPYPLKGPLNMIFCRNVMIYFDRKIRTGMVHEFHRLLKPGGYLLVGHAESITGLSDGFKCIKPSVYMRG